MLFHKRVNRLLLYNLLNGNGTDMSFEDADELQACVHSLVHACKALFLSQFAQAFMDVQACL